ncbi:hypothetical protein VE03_05393 [Pseudogymnoascus sp. 23342-1-I1]|nr:hypothetical protein VE03_05393 [Pseudogymnoascus sp. 23342-1-I1]
MRTFGLPDSLANDPAAQVLMAIMSGRNIAMGLSIWLLYLQGKLSSVDTVLGLNAACYMASNLGISHGSRALQEQVCYTIVDTSNARCRTWMVLFMEFYATHAAMIDMAVRAIGMFGVTVLAVAATVMGIYGIMGMGRLVMWLVWAVVRFMVDRIICFILGFILGISPGVSSQGDGDGGGRVTIDNFSERLVRGQTADGFYIRRRDGLVDVYLNVPEILRHFRLPLDIPKAWRIVTIREAVFLINERERPR